MSSESRCRGAAAFLQHISKCAACIAQCIFALVRVRFLLFLNSRCVHSAHLTAGAPLGPPRCPTPARRMTARTAALLPRLLPRAWVGLPPPGSAAKIPPPPWRRAPSHPHSPPDRHRQPKMDGR